jgi:hypothetical protein
LSTDADCPAGHELAAQIGLSIRYDDETCEFEAIRYFYDGPCNPFLDDHRKVPNARLQELGVFLLPSNRQWDRLLTFSSSSFLKMLKASGAIPGPSIENLKSELRNPTNRIEDDAKLRAILESAQRELSTFRMLTDSQLAYRPTLLDARSVMQSLMPHVLHNGFLLPFSRHGSGMNSLQAFLIVLAFGEQRKKDGRNFILIAEEPELHLHPCLHARLANRIRSLSEQSVVTTHSPALASTYKPNEAIFIKNDSQILTALTLREEAISKLPTDALRNLYLKNRVSVYEALMGPAIIIPEGDQDRRWLLLWQRVVEANEHVVLSGPISVAPTQDAQIVDTFRELQRFRDDSLPLLDGDSAGNTYRDQLKAISSPPVRIAQLGNKAGIEALVAWIVEPCLKAAGPTLSSMLTGIANPDLKCLTTKLIDNKKNLELHENLAWEAGQNKDSVQRAGRFLDDLYRISAGENPKDQGWLAAQDCATTIYTATHIKKS